VLLAGGGLGGIAFRLLAIIALVTALVVVRFLVLQSGQQLSTAAALLRKRGSAGLAAAFSSMSRSVGTPTHT
jgi:hypothetical protein